MSTYIINTRWALALSCLITLACGPSEPAAVEPAADQTTTQASPTSGRISGPDGTDIAYTLSGQGPTTLVMIHGWACDQTYWRHQIEAFADQYRVLTLDLPGHGLSGAERETWSLEDYGADVAAVIDALSLDRVVLVGHSMGGPVALEAEPLLAEKVLAVIGVETFHDAEFSIPAEQWQPLVDAYRQDYVGTCRRAVAGMFMRPENTTPNDATEGSLEKKSAVELAALQAEVEADMCAGPETVGIALMESFGAYQGAGPMARAEVPIRAINAEYSSPTRLEVNQRHRPDFQAVTLGEVGHFLMLEAPERFNEVLSQVLDEVLAAQQNPVGSPAPRSRPAPIG